jgi:hypothetical protein
MAVRLLQPYAGQAAGTIFIGTADLEATLQATDVADGRVELASNYATYISGMSGSPVTTGGLPPLLAARGFFAPANRLFRSAARGITPIKTVMASAPTYTQGTAGAASTLNAGATNIRTLSAASIPINDPRIQIVGGAATSRGAPLFTLGGVTFPSITTAYRVNAHGEAIRFATNAPSIDLGAELRGQPFTAYVTDLTTRVRARIAANDTATTAGECFHLLAFGSSSPRIIEIYVDSGNPTQYFTQINVTANYDLWAPPAADELAIGYEGDSWAQGTGNGNTNGVKLTVTDFMAERLGVANPRVSGVGGTGFATNGGANNTFLQRLQAGDMDASRIGALDVFVVPLSVNDVLNATAAQIAAAAPQVYAAARAAQPNAIIISFSGQTTSSTPFNQAASDAAKAGMASLNDPNMIFVDTGPSGENWVPSGVIASWFTGTNNHLNDAGMVGYGYRMADSIVNAVRGKYGL